ncbi:MAG: PTS fructose transporter subunit IIB [Mycoplasmoidaceae bacterium]|nr:PTS fructose transporter subunit IIB [Mycoplasmoidaceae bacterium]
MIPKQNLSDLHMEYLARISTALMDESICDKLLKAKDKKVVYNLIAKAINEKDTDLSITKSSKKKSKPTKIDSSKPFIIGVSACATGIAHTFMAREALEKGASKLGYNIHIETEGQNGREHAVTPELIEKADYVVIAADISVDTERFAGKKIYFCDTNAAINNPEQTLKNVISKAAIGGQISSKKNAQTSAKGESTGLEFKATGKKMDKFMKPFLSGVSHMIPVIVFSGIIYALLNAINMALPKE